MRRGIPIGTVGPGLTYYDTRALTIDERLAFAFWLWEEDCRIFSEVHGVSPAEAAHCLKTQRRSGRIPLFADSPS